jgi:hypothetical protein
LRKAGDIAYVADWTNGLFVLNVSDPAHPTFVYNYQLLSKARDVEIIGAYVYVADYDTGIHVLIWR